MPKRTPVLARPKRTPVPAPYPVCVYCGRWEGLNKIYMDHWPSKMRGSIHETCHEKFMEEWYGTD